MNYQGLMKMAAELISVTARLGNALRWWFGETWGRLFCLCARRCGFIKRLDIEVYSTVPFAFCKKGLTVDFKILRSWLVW